MEGQDQVFGARIIDVPTDEIANVDELCRTNLHIREPMSEMLAESYDKTRKEAFEHITCKAIYEAFDIEELNAEAATLRGGVRFASNIIADALQGAEYTVAFAVVAHGVEALIDDPDNSMLDTMMYSGWGVGFSTGSQQWTENVIRLRAHELGLYSGKSWSPGLEGVAIELQRPLFQLAGAEKIGVELTGAATLRPMMSVAGLIAIGKDPDLESQETAWMI